MRRAHRKAHVRAWIMLAVALPVGVGLALLLRTGAPPADPGIATIRAASEVE